MNTRELLFGLYASLPSEELTFSQLYRLCLPFAVSETSLRTTLARMNGKGLIQTGRRGRSAVYGFTEKSRAISGNVSAGFRLSVPSDWAGDYWGVLFSLPSEETILRHKLRTRLEAYRYALWMPGLWIRPILDRKREARDRDRILYPEFCRVIEFRPEQEFSPGEVRRLWDLKEKGERMSSACENLEAALGNLDGLTPEEAFAQRMIRGDEAVKALGADPLLPPALLPTDWPGPRLRELFRLWNRHIEPRAKLFYGEIIKGGCHD